MTDMLDELHPNQDCQISFLLQGKKWIRQSDKFLPLFDEAETDWRPEGQQVTQFLEYGLCTIYVPFSGQWRWSFGNRHDKKVTTSENCDIPAKNTTLHEFHFGTSCLLHISFRNRDIHVNHTRENSQPCVSVVSHTMQMVSE